MSTKSTLFLTKDNEHCYYECSSQHRDAEGNFTGYDIEELKERLCSLKERLERLERNTN
ncbi:MAG: hypothetical protein ACN6OJ_15020 [Chryseobacterium sp.]|uniref:hypothetical protein n=1 Tax=Chryseobacterium sp. TaxID=1871047 RepID=UPI003D131851